MYAAKTLIGAHRFLRIFLLRIVLQQLEASKYTCACECCANDLLLDPDPFDWFFESVAIFIMVIFHDFENS